MIKPRTYRLPVGFAIPLALMIALVFVGLQSMDEIQNRLKQIIEHNNVKTSLVVAMRYAARERTMSLYRMVTLEDPFEKDDEFLRFNGFGAEFLNARIALLKMSLTSEEKDILSRQGALTNATVDSQDTIVDLAIGDENEKAIAILYEITVPAQNAVFSELTALLNIQHKETLEAAKASTEEYEHAKHLMLILWGVSTVLGLFVALLVIRQTHLAEKTLYLEKEKAQVTLHSIGDGVITTDKKGIVEYLNPVAEKMTGWKNNEAVGLPLDTVFYLLDSKNKKITDSPVKLAMRELRIISSANHFISSKAKVEAGVKVNSEKAGSAGNREESNTINNTENYAIEYTAGPMYDDANTALGAVLVFRNVTAIRNMALKMRYQATHDSLTGLINRSEFEKRLDLALSAARKNKTRHVLCYFDLDQFKIVNDTCGHVAGDELLKQLVTLLSSFLRRADTLARLGGDEFGLLLVDCDIKNAEIIADKIRQQIKDYRFSWDNKSFFVGASFGLVEISPESGTVTDILSAADSACYVAKDLGRDRLHVFQCDDEELSRRQGEMQWLPRIREALEKDMFNLYCQQILPIGGLDTTRFQDASAPLNNVRYEILIRLHDSEGGVIPPMGFIPAAERYHLMPSIDRWVVRSVFEFLNAHHHNLLNVQQSWAINLSGQSICDDEFLKFIIDQLRLNKIDPTTICFEITETAAVKNLSRASEFIAELKVLGCRFSLDDFGSGLSSFAYLKNLPVDYLKIDGSFVKDMLTDSIDLAMVKSINQIGHTMGIKTIAEFVENEAILEQLQLMRIDYAQGYGVHMPQPMTELVLFNGV